MASAYKFCSYEDQLAEFLNVFELFDTIGDKKIHMSQIGDLLRTLGQNPTESEVVTLTHQYGSDVNNSQRPSPLNFKVGEQKLTVPNTWSREGVASPPASCMILHNALDPELGEGAVFERFWELKILLSYIMGLVLFCIILLSVLIYFIYYIFN